MKPKYFLISSFIGLFFLLTGNLKAQMVGSDIFLKGKYVEVGIGNLGYYGSGSTPPSGYHSHLPGAGSLGYVADPAMDGWAVGTPAYMGDYFVPGSPFEGWELQVNGKRCQAYNAGPGSIFHYDGGMGTCTGNNTGYSTSGSNVIGTWQGMIDSILVTQTTILDTNSLYFLVKINLTNLAVAPKNNIYYFRSVDPDNDQSWPGGSFYTTNMLEHQMPDTFGASVVSAVGVSSPLAYLAFGTTDTASRAVTYTSWGLTVTQDLADVYSGTYYGGGADYVAGIPHYGDMAIGLVMSIPHLATVDSAGDSVYRTTSTTTLHPANTASFSYFFAFSHPAVDSAIAHSPDPVTTIPTLEIKNVNSADIKVYPNPSKDIVSITGLSTTDRISMYDMMGRETGQNWTVNTNGTNTFRYSNVPAGAYILLVTDANGNIKTRVPVRKQ